MEFAVVFFLHSLTVDVVPAKAVQGDLKRGVTTKVRWGGRLYAAKILFIGPKELCELKVPQVTAEGELVDGPFEIAAVRDPTSSEVTSVNRNLEEMEIEQRMINIEERSASTNEMLSRIERMLLNFDQRMSDIERTVNRIDQKLPAAQGQMQLRYRNAANTRARKVRKDMGDKTPLLLIEDEPVTDGAFNDAFDFYE
ncbi:unnamed protein product [Nippostrongylus brasiliensis]|uniref:t-SNARE coiled-coil homology domain-containing protein n=1 Tax=Nippostrongylus brasiliensis TaxID=27835 RepID=A0A0N4Y092_NIPBR|nr:hypothetical protein Q1695_000974 [Nippostrongylus brasiliensis]VDL72512.1 unnamed protein product [Nippostrongylus brasiliensis]